MVSRFQAWLLGPIKTSLFGKRKGEKMLTSWMRAGRVALLGMFVAGCHPVIIPGAEPDEVTVIADGDVAVFHGDNNNVDLGDGDVNSDDHGTPRRDDGPPNGGPPPHWEDNGQNGGGDPNGEPVPDPCPKLETLQVEPWFGGFYPQAGAFRTVNIALVQAVDTSDDPELVQALSSCYDFKGIAWTVYDLDGNTFSHEEFSADDYLAAGQPLSTKTLHQLKVPDSSFDLLVHTLWSGPNGDDLMTRRFWVDR
ncbi:MAG: hypothetical protein J5J00_03535 [Deltaproteobacteria bacterium]|nr:hypothetical protein [Deltaproteobacteria bacterium]